ncbi:putative aldouronate transport system substrate-binding protein [Pullulanibacillus pueri]|uniref:ABC transporter substrate-binding protein n=1 Tax=Pullulanibacillus pueri TaxID=1437324 RepID=A0A8J3ENG0_9BACL|nr:extracellular solute-binding protein [Pullulanibacillus pueri]MBM7683314.1 putative aldouronate transport system substrate-binding protein [Pullulanibacillus pueri]GGH86418.1 ABC transporter substrate-binding protein [Pullulanibacillus pueri]
MKKRGILLLLLLFTLSVVLAGCSNDKQTDANGNTNDSDGGSTELTVFAPQSSEQNLKTSWFTKQMENKFNIKFKWQTTTQDASSASQKRQISLASGDLPDAYMLIPWVDQFSTNELLKYGKQGVLIPLNDLIKKYAPNIQKTLDSNAQFKAMTVAPDGNIYGIPQLVECYHCSWPNKMYINNDWLEKLNLKMPKTTEDFKKVLEAFKNQDPNGNGKKDEVPLSGATNIPENSIIPFLMNGFIYDDGVKHLILNDGKVDLVANKPEWKEGLEYIRSLYKEGLIDPGAFTQNGDAFLKLGDNAKTEILGAAATKHPGEFVSDQKRLYSKNYLAVPPLQGPNADYSTYISPIAPGADFVLTQSSTNADRIAAIKMMDYLFTTEGDIVGQFGKEGVDWRKPKKGEVAIEEGTEPIYATIPAKEGAKPDNNAWGALAQYGNTKEVRNGQIQSTEVYSQEGYERRLQNLTHDYDGQEPDNLFPFWSVWVDPSDADEVSMIETNLKSYIDQNTLKFITGDKDLDKDWEAYVKGFDQLNLKRYLELMQKAYDNSGKPSK